METPLHYRIRPGALRVIVPVTTYPGTGTLGRPPMRTLVHLSDLHPGRSDAAIIPPLLATVTHYKPDVMVVSG